MTDGDGEFGDKGRPANETELDHFVRLLGEGNDPYDAQPHFYPRLAYPLEYAPGSAGAAEDEVDSRTRIVIGRRDEPSRHDQFDYEVDLGAGPLMVTGPDGAGKSTALCTIARAFVDANPSAIIIGVGIDQAPESPRIGAFAHYALPSGRLGDSALVVEQLLEVFRRRLPLVRDDKRPLQPILVLFDDVDRLVEGLQLHRRTGPAWLAMLTEVLAEGKRVAIYTAIGAKHLDATVRALVRTTLALEDPAEGRPGRSSTSRGGSIQVFSLPEAPLLAEGAFRLGPIEDWPVELSEDDMDLGAMDSAHPVVAIGVTERTHELVGMELTGVFAIVGPARSGKTTALATVAHRSIDAGLRPAVIASRRNQETWKRYPFYGGLRSLWEEGPQDLRSLETCSVLADDLADGTDVLLVDDVAWAESLIHNSFWAAVFDRGVPMIFTLTPSKVHGQPFGWRQLVRDHDRLLYLSPDTYLSETDTTVVLRPGATFPPGRGVLKAGSEADVVQVVPTPDSLQERDRVHGDGVVIR